MSSLTPTLTFMLCTVKRARCGRVYHEFVAQINALPRGISTGPFFLPFEEWESNLIDGLTDDIIAGDSHHSHCSG